MDDTCQLQEPLSPCGLHKLEPVGTLGCKTATAYLKKWIKNRAWACECEIGAYCPHVVDPAMNFYAEQDAWDAYNRARGFADVEHVLRRAPIAMATHPPARASTT